MMKLSSRLRSVCLIHLLLIVIQCKLVIQAFSFIELFTPSRRSFPKELHVSGKDYTEASVQGLCSYLPSAF